MAYYIAHMKHSSNRQVTVHGLDTGIHAGMTAFLARQDLWITVSAPRGNTDSQRSPDEAQRNPGFGGLNPGFHFVPSGLLAPKAGKSKRLT